MRAARLHQALASLYEDLLPASAKLSGEAEQAISRRVTRRWATRGIGAAVAAALAFVGTNAIVAATDGAHDAPAAASPTASDEPMPQLVRIPLGGGPEFDGLEDHPICGTPAPQAQPRDGGFTITAGIGPATDPWPNQSVDALTASVSFDGGDPGPTARGPLWIVLLRDGVVAGATALDMSQLRDATVPRAGDIGIESPAYSETFQCRKLSLRGPREYDLFPVDPGNYTAVAYTRIFATEESVALGQAVPEHLQLTESQKMPGGVYLPGSFDCAFLENYGVALRACLPDFVPGAVVDKNNQTVSVMYEPADGFEPFDVTLVSEPFDITLKSWRDDMDEDTVYVSNEDVTQFDSADQVVCGATVNDLAGFAPSGDARFGPTYGVTDVGIEAWLAPPVEGVNSTYDARVMPWFAPDGASVRLDAGAKVVYFRDGGSSNRGWPEYHVAGFAPLEMLGVIPYDRYQGPTNVQLRVGEPSMCPGTDEADGQIAASAVILGTWTVTPVNGPQIKRELLSPTDAWLPSTDQFNEGG